MPEGSLTVVGLYPNTTGGQSERFAHWASWKRPSWTNDIIFPGGRNDPEILEAESDLTSDEFARQYGAEFTDKTGTVMKEFDEDVRPRRAVDFNPGANLFMAVEYGFD